MTQNTLTKLLTIDLSRSIAADVINLEREDEMEGNKLRRQMWSKQTVESKTKKRQREGK